MDTDKYTKHAAERADQIAQNLRNGIQDTYRDVRSAESRLAGATDELTSRAAQTASDAVGEANARVKEGLKGVRNAVQSGRDVVSQSSESLLTFTRQKPVQALLIAAVAGAFLWSLAKAAASR